MTNRSMTQLPRSFSLLACLLLLGAVFTGCASTGAGSAPAGPPPEEVIGNLITSTLASLAEGDVDTVMTGYAEDFTWDNGDKAGMQAFLQQAVDAGFMDGMTADTENMVVAVDGDSASVSGVTIEGAFGLFDLTFDLENRDGQWMVIKQTQQ